MEQPKQSSRKQKQKDARSNSYNDGNGTERLKIIVRRLPHNLPEEVFWQSVQAWVTEETATWKMFCAGKMKKRINKESVPSRAYIAFKNEEALATFSRAYDGHTFRDKSGNESHAVVEFAPYQKVPVEKRKPDPRINTIDKDEDYISFLESLKKSDKSEPVSLEALVAAAQPAPPPTTTPLLEALKAEKLAQKDKETILRSHAHYKESAIAAKKEETKKKAAAVVQAQAATQATGATQKSANEGGGTPQPMSKKSRKAAIAAQKAAAQDTHSPVRIAVKPSPSVASAAAPNVAPAPPTVSRSHRDRPSKGQKAAAAASAQVRATEIISPAPPTSAPASLATEGGAPTTPSLTPTPTPVRRGRPVVGIGRHLEAALNGVVGGGGERKRRGEKEKEKEKEAGSVSSPAGGGATEGKNSTVGSVTGPGSSGGKRKEYHSSGGKQKEDKPTTGGGTGGTSVLQRSEASDLMGDVAIVQRPDTQPGPHADAPPSGRGGSGGKRGGRGRGRGAHRGG
ncbi:Smg-4/UPF3 family-domain-containing protein [Pisolithus microcarpus]|nr:Smg-4/UPF3 family-domain-containing protein [Pisolithus microcarpus]